MHLPSMWIEDKITCHTLIFFPKLTENLLVRKNTRYFYWNMNRINQTICLPLFKRPPHNSCLLNNPVLFSSPPQGELLCSHTLLWLTTSTGTGVPYSPLPVSVSSQAPKPHSAYSMFVLNLSPTSKSGGQAYFKKATQYTARDFQRWLNTYLLWFQDRSEFTLIHFRLLSLGKQYLIKSNKNIKNNYILAVFQMHYNMQT